MKAKRFLLSKSLLDSTVSTPLLLDVNVVHNGKILCPRQFRFENNSGVTLEFLVLNSDQEVEEYQAGVPLYDLLPVESGGAAVNQTSGLISKIVIHAVMITTSPDGAEFMGMYYQ